MSTCTVTLVNSEKTQVKVIEKEQFTVGRGPECDITLAEASVSRVHLYVYVQNQQVFIEDKSSANGTFLNGLELPRNKVHAVRATDALRIAKSNTLLRFKLSGEQIIDTAQHETASAVGPVQRQDPEPMPPESNLEIVSARREAAKIIFSAEAEAEKRVQNIIDAAKKSKEDAEQESKRLLSHAEKSVQSLLEESRKQGQELIQEARRLAQKVRDESEQNRQAELKKAKDSSTALMVDAEKKALRLFEEAKEKGIAEAHQINKSLVSDAQAKADEIAQTAAKNITELEAKIKAKESQFAQLEKQVQDLSQQIVTSTSEIESRRHSLAVLAKNTEDSGAKYLKFLEDIKKLEEELMQKKKDLSESHTSNQELQKSKLLLEKNLAERKVQLVQLDVEIKQLQNKASTQKSELEEASRLQKAQFAETIKFQQEEADEAKRIQRAEFEKAMKLQADQLSQVQAEVKLAKESLSDVQKKLDETLLQQSATQAAIQKGQEQLSHLKNSSDQESTQLENLKSELASTEVKRMRILTDIGSLEEKKSLLESDFENEKSKVFESLEKFKANQAQQEIDLVESLQKEHAKRLQKFEQDLLEEIFQAKEGLVSSLLLAVQSEALKVLDSNKWNEINPQVQAVIEEKIESQVSLLAQSDVGSQIGSLKVKKKRDMRYPWMAAGALLTAIAFLGGPKVYEAVILGDSPMENRVAEEAKKRAEDLERRKFNPPQDLEVRETYRDAVIYTKGYVELISEEAFSKKHFDETSIYMFKTWRVDEEKTLQLIAISTSLIKELSENKNSIHPDFIKEGLQKMSDVEANALSRMKELLGTEVRVNSFLKFERELISKEILATDSIQDSE